MTRRVKSLRKTGRVSIAKARAAVATIKSTRGEKSLVRKRGAAKKASASRKHGRQRSLSGSKAADTRFSLKGREPVTAKVTATGKQLVAFHIPVDSRASATNSERRVLGFITE